MRKAVLFVLLAVLCGAAPAFSQEPVLMPGWPVQVRYDSRFACLLQGVTLYDLDKDGDKDLIVGVDSVVYAYDYTAASLAGWPDTIRNTEAHCTQSPAVGDIDADGLPEVVLITRRDPEGGDLYAFNHDGTLCDGFPVDLGTCYTQHSLYDLDADGALEIIAGRSELSPDSIWQVKVFYGNGEMFPGWPVDGVWPLGIAVGDIDCDDQPEIVVAAGLGKVFAFERHGEIMEGFPIKLSHGGGEYVVTGPPVLFDLNGDDTLEIGQAYGKCIEYNMTVGSIGVFDIHGNQLEPWPLYHGEHSRAGVVFGPLEPGGELFAAFGSVNLGKYCLANMDAQLEPGWPYVPERCGGNYDQPVIGDISGDGCADITFNYNVAPGYMGRLFAFDRSGQLLDYFPLELDGATFPGNASLADVDNDGMVEMAVPTILSRLPYFSLYLFKIQGVPYVEERFPWPMSCHDPQHTNNLHYRYRTGVPDEIVDPSTPTRFVLSQNYPNPFNPTTEVEYFLPWDRHVKLEIFNMLGEKVATLVDRRQTAGYKTIRWNSGKSASGIYFYKLTAGDFTDVKMMTLLR